jgi:hypothetical protein
MLHVGRYWLPHNSTRSFESRAGVPQASRLPGNLSPQFESKPSPTSSNKFMASVSRRSLGSVTMRSSIPSRPRVLWMFRVPLVVVLRVPNRHQTPSEPQSLQPGIDQRCAFGSQIDFPQVKQRLTIRNPPGMPPS